MRELIGGEGDRVWVPKDDFSCRTALWEREGFKEVHAVESIGHLEAVETLDSGRPEALSVVA